MVPESRAAAAPTHAGGVFGLKLTNPLPGMAQLLKRACVRLSQEMYARLICGVAGMYRDGVQAIRHGLACLASEKRAHSAERCSAG